MCQPTQRDANAAGSLESEAVRSRGPFGPRIVDLYHAAHVQPRVVLALYQLVEVQTVLGSLLLRLRVSALLGTATARVSTKRGTVMWMRYEASAILNETNKLDRSATAPSPTTQHFTKPWTDPEPESQTPNPKPGVTPTATQHTASTASTAVRGGSGSQFGVSGFGCRPVARAAR